MVDGRNYVFVLDRRLGAISVRRKHCRMTTARILSAQMIVDAAMGQLRLL